MSKAHKLILLGILFLTPIVIVFSVINFENTYRDKFYPGVYVDGENVAGKTYADVFNKYKVGSDAFYQNGISLVFEGIKGRHMVNIPVSASGMNTDQVVEYFSLGDWEQTINDAYKLGRTGSYINQLKEQLVAVIKRKTFEFPSVYQNEAIKSLYTRELENFLVTPKTASFSYSNGVFITQESDGEYIDFSEVTKKINNNLSSFDSTPIHIKASAKVSNITKDDLKSFLLVSEQIAKNMNIVFQYKENRWPVSGKKLITWLTLNKEKRLTIDKKQLEVFLFKNILPIIDNPPQNSRFADVGGRLVEVTKGTTGNMVDVERTIAVVEETLFGQKKSLGLADSLLASTASQGNVSVLFENGKIIIPLELQEAPPIITKETISQFDIRELVATATTNFKGSSSNRVHNIKTGVSKLSGIILAPGDEFSAVFSLGDTGEEQGFVAEYVIKGNKSIKEFGGGLCQVSTTLFRLALNAGLPITERINHRYVVGYYGAGLDATIYGPHPDLRFVNDTNNYLLLQGSIKGSELTFELFGQKDGRQVSISEPVVTEVKPAPATKYVMSNEIPYATQKCSEIPRKGMTTEVDYVVTMEDGEVREQKFKSVYQPWQKICLIGLAR